MRPFQSASTLSSRNGRTRPSRAARSFSSAAPGAEVSSGFRLRMFAPAAPAPGPSKLPRSLTP